MCHERQRSTDKHVSIGEERRVYLESVFEREARSVASRSGTFIDSMETDEAAVEALKTLRGGLWNDVKEAR